VTEPHSQFASDGHRRPRPNRRIVIAGAGIAGLESLLALRASAGEQVELRVVAPGEAFLHWPLSVADAFAGAGGGERDLGELLRTQRAKRTVDVLASVDVDEQTVRTRAGERIPYDELVVAVGGLAVPAVRGALAFRGLRDVPALRELHHELEGRRISHVVFAAPESNAWPLPLYELAVLTAARIAAFALPAHVSLVTAERTPLARFGPAAGTAIARLFERRGIELHVESDPSGFRGGLLELHGGGTLRADRVVALPRLRGPAIDGLPHDDDGFLPIDELGRVPGADGVHVAGDAAASALKYGGLAAAQADAVARTIAAACGATVGPRPFSTIARGLLLTGEDPLYVRAEAMDDEACSAHGDGVHPCAQRRRRPETRLRPGALWWPPASLAGPHLARHLPGPAGAHPSRRALGPALDLLLLLADHDAWVGDHEMAVRSLDCAEAMAGRLPAHYVATRRRWLEAAEAQPRAFARPCAPGASGP